MVMSTMLAATAVMSSAPTVAQGLPELARWTVVAVGPPSGSPVLAGPTVVVPLQSGAIAAHRITDGTLAWSTELAAEKALASDAERVYIAAGDAIHALDAETGAVRWRLGLSGALTAAPRAHEGWLILALGGELLGVRATDGSIIWRKPVGAVEFRPTIDGEMLIASLVDGHVAAMDVRTGEPRWTREVGSSPTEPLAIGGRVYVGTRNKWFYELDLSSGLVESHRYVGAVLLGRAAADDRHVYFTALDNVLWAVDRRSGAVKWRRGLSYRPAAGPVVLGSHVLVPGPVASMPAFDARTGDPVGAITFAARLVALPLLGETEKGLFAVGVTGNLENKWNMILFEPSPVPLIPIRPLTALPGETVLLPTAPDPSQG
jgi:PQQ-like domain